MADVENPNIAAFYIDVDSIGPAAIAVEQLTDLVVKGVPFRGKAVNLRKLLQGQKRIKDPIVPLQ